MINWNHVDVREFLTFIGLPLYVNLFKEEYIFGRVTINERLSSHFMSLFVLMNWSQGKF